MFSVDEREKLFIATSEFIYNNDSFEGLLLIGSGAIGYRDKYSDIDLMAGCYNDDKVSKANEDLIAFFYNIGAIYIDKRSWAKTILGLSVYFESGLSIDISFAPTDILMICSPQWKIVSDKTGNFTEHIKSENEKFIHSFSNYGIDNSIHHKFIYALRRCEVALKREEYIYAEISLAQARQIILNVETVNESKKLHQFKAYNTLNEEFINLLKDTYPSELTAKEILKSKENLLNLYLKLVSDSANLYFDNTQLKLINCFTN